LEREGIRYETFEIRTISEVIFFSPMERMEGSRPIRTMILYFFLLILALQMSDPINRRTCGELSTIA
jgi:uncharacterized membrane protein